MRLPSMLESFVGGWKNYKQFQKQNLLRNNFRRNKQEELFINKNLELLVLRGDVLTCLGDARCYQ
jgi:hypothetical protein